MNRSLGSHSVGGLAVALLVVLASATTGAKAERPRPEQARSNPRTTLQRQASVARRAVRELDLTRRQARRLLHLVEQAAALYIEGYQEQARLLPEMIEAFDDFARQDALNEGFSGEVERRTAMANHEGKETRERITERLIDLEQQAAVVLTRSQRAQAGLDNTDQRRSGRKRRNRSTKDRLAAARQELEAVHKQIHPRLGKLGRSLLNPAAAAALCELAGTQASEIMRRAVHVVEHGTEEFPASQFDQQQSQVERLRAQINNWNLINGLHLDGEQIEQVVAIYQGRGTGRTATDRRSSRALDQSPAARTARELAVEEVLNPGQVQVLAEFKPCLIPPKNLKDPVRIGQAADHSHVERWLTRARRTPAPRRDELVERALQLEAQRFGELPPYQRRQRRALLLDTARRIAAMSDVDFELNKAELAEQVAPRDRVEELRTQIAALSRAERQPGPIARFMLNPQFIRQLRERGRQLAEGVQSKPTDLAKGPQAENCDKSCAIRTKKK